MGLLTNWVNKNIIPDEYNAAMDALKMAMPGAQAQKIHDDDVLAEQIRTRDLAEKGWTRDEKGEWYDPEAKAIKELSTFGADYEKTNPFQYAQDNPYMQNLTRVAETQKAQAGQSAANALASRGMSDSGMVLRNQANIAKDMTTQLQGYAANDYWNQYKSYYDKQNQAYNQKLTGFNLGTEARDRAMAEYYNKQTLIQQDALTKWQQEQAKKDEGMSWVNAGINLLDVFIPG